MKITAKYDCPDDTYIRVGDVEPEIAGDDLLMTAGRGTRRGWGRPTADYEAVLNTPVLTSVVIWWSTKHASGQAWRHYRNTPGGWQRATWVHLTDYERQTILDAYQQPAVPGWVKSPGKLASQRAKPRQHERLEHDEQGAIIGYKWLGVTSAGPGDPDTALFYSPYNCQLWRGGELTADAIPTEYNENGVYAAKTADSLSLTPYQADGRRLVRLLLSGIVIEGQFGLRAEHAYILEVYDADR